MKNNTQVLLILLLLAVVGLFTFLSPHLSGVLYPFIRSSRWDTFVSDAVSHKHINPQKYWELREFYDGGSFVFNIDGLHDNSATSFLKNESVEVKSVYVDRILLYRTSPRTKSIDAIVTASKAAELFEITSDGKKLLQEKNEYIIGRQDNNFVVTFLKPIAEMKKANGFVNYIDYKEYLADKYWFSELILHLD